MTYPLPDDNRATFALAARSFADLVARIPADAWDGPGLGEWNLRSLVGHASRSLITVITYLPRVTTDQAVRSTTEYYARASRMMAADPAAVTERGRQAGISLGSDPLATVRGLADECLAALDAVGADPVIETIVGGMRLSRYLVTRTFELVVHGLDIADAAGLAFGPPERALADSLHLAVDISVSNGDGLRVLHALTGRHPLPDRFSVV